LQRCMCCSGVSVLFSEPKIPQFINVLVDIWNGWSFSALQRAENSSIPRWALPAALVQLGFSALQRAENSSIQRAGYRPFIASTFQCSSASRKFLNRAGRARGRRRRRRFSALQRAENSSIMLRITSAVLCTQVSVLFSEPKIPQLRRRAGAGRLGRRVSVLFSEPKIPQLRPGRFPEHARSKFQCSSASRKFLNTPTMRRAGGVVWVSVLFSEPKIPQFDDHPRPQCTLRRFQCSSASRKFLNRSGRRPRSQRRSSFSALQRAENSSMKSGNASLIPCSSFQCSSASRKFLNRLPHPPFAAASGFQCSSASRKFLNSVSYSKSRKWRGCFSALQRAENSSIMIDAIQPSKVYSFSALQRAENSSIEQ